MTTIYVDSRKRVAGSDSDFEEFFTKCGFCSYQRRQREVSNCSFGAASTEGALHAHFKKDLPAVSVFELPIQLATAVVSVWEHNF